MPRIPRQRLGAGVFHVINRAIDRRWIFNTDADKQFFVELLVKQRKKYTLNLYHWVIMSNHFHLAVETLDIHTLSSYVGKVCEYYTKYFRKKHGGNGPLWQGRYKSKAVQKEGYLGRLGRYIERNPVRAKIDDIRYAWDYKWSSARSYVSDIKDPLVVVTCHPFWIDMGLTDDARRITYRDYLLSEAEAIEDETLFQGHNSVIGDNDFKSKIMNVLGRSIARKPGRPPAVKTE